MQISVTMLSMTGGHNDPWLPSGTARRLRHRVPGHARRACATASTACSREGARGDPRRRRRDQDRVVAAASSRRPTIRWSPTSRRRRSTRSCATAADLGTWVMSHAHGPEGIKRAVRAGVRSIDHGTYLDEEAAAMMVERGTWLVPTLTAGDTTEALADDEKVQPAVREKLRGLGRPGVRRDASGRRGRREGRDGHRLPGRAARHEPERAAAHGRATGSRPRRRCTRRRRAPPS